MTNFSPVMDGMILEVWSETSGNQKKGEWVAKSESGDDYMYPI
jgi:hypothetical protein